MLFYSKTKNVHQKTTPINITAYVTGPYILVNMGLDFCNVNMVKIDFFGGEKNIKFEENQQNTTCLYRRTKRKSSLCLKLRTDQNSFF